MIAYLSGSIVYKGSNNIILFTSGVGYKVFVAENFLSDLKIDQGIEVYIYHSVREDASDLYGFRNPEELDLFELLLSVSGIGPKSALAVLSMASPNDIKEAIMRDDAGLLTKVSGIGKKTAERVVLELKNKIGRSGAFSGSTLGSASFGDELDALLSLGFPLSQAREALNSVEASILDSGERLKAALKTLNK